MKNGACIRYLVTLVTVTEKSREELKMSEIETEVAPPSVESQSMASTAKEKKKAKGSKTQLILQNP